MIVFLFNYLSILTFSDLSIYLSIYLFFIHLNLSIYLSIILVDPSSRWQFSLSLHSHIPQIYRICFFHLSYFPNFYLLLKSFHHSRLYFNIFFFVLSSLIFHIHTSPFKNISPYINSHLQAQKVISINVYIEYLDTTEEISIFWRLFVCFCFLLFVFSSFYYYYYYYFIIIIIITIIIKICDFVPQPNSKEI